MTINDLNKILQQRENEHIEFKLASNQYDETKLMKYCIALANEKGGQLILGVNDAREIKGSNAFRDIGATKSKILKKLHFRVEIYEILTDLGRVLVFDIPSRPIGTPLNHEGAYLMRSNEELVSMTPDQLQRIFAEGKPDFELQIAKQDLSSDEVVSLLDIQGYFDLMQIPLPETRDGMIDRFIREKLLVKNTQGMYDITNLGAILFAKDMKDFDTVSRKAMRVIVYDGNSKIKTKRDITGTKGYAMGYELMVSYVMGQIPTNEVITDALREEHPMYPKLAIRELIANALIHQDFEVGGSSAMVELYDNRIEISSPGKPIITTDRFIDEYQSRNEKLADMMRRLRICEEKGSGIDKALSEVEFYQLPAIDIQASETRTIVKMFSHKPFADMSKKERITACYQHCSLRYVMSGHMTNTSFRERFGLSDTKTNKDVISKVIGHALEEGKVKYSDPENKSKRYAKYIPYWA